MDSIKVLAMVEEEQVHDLKRRELIRYVLKLRKFVLKQNEKIVYQKNKISHLVICYCETLEIFLFTVKTYFRKISSKSFL